MTDAPTSLLDDILVRFRSAPEAEQTELREIARKHMEHILWVPTPGPQSEAYYSTADVMLYGGEAGGAKSDLILGLAFTAHKNSLIMRRQYSDLGGLTERAVKINRTRKGFNGSPPPKLRTADDRLIEFGAAQHVGDEAGFQGRPHDLLGFDEAWQFAVEQIRFLMTWLRSTDPDQRCRVVLASNPPVEVTGEWMVHMFGPWLDPNHHDPAKPGELRWFASDDDGNDLEVDGPEPVMMAGKLVRPLSRTFIRSRLADNPFLARTNYGAQLDNLPEPYRSAFRDGNFLMARKDAPRQVIPTNWVREAQARWTPNPPPNIPMCALGCDIAQGGDDEFVMAPRHDMWFAKPICVPGSQVPDGPSGAGLIIAHRRDSAAIIIDMGGGYGGSTYDHLKDNGFIKGDLLFVFKGAETSMARTSDNQLGFTNKRTEAYWRFREALDPSQAGGSPVALPPDPMLVADLTAPTFEITTRGIKLETKEDVVKKLRRSPDRGDAVVIAATQGAMQSNQLGGWKPLQKFGARPNVIRAHGAQRDFLRR